MAPRILVCAIVAAFALVGCGTGSKSDDVGRMDLTCTSAPCNVPVKQPWFPGAALDVPGTVTVPTGATITWTLSGWPLTHFPPVNLGIEFDTPNPGFNCSIDTSDKRKYTCTNTAPRGGPYHYKIKTEGPGHAPDKDPYVVNN